MRKLNVKPRLTDAELAAVRDAAHFALAGDWDPSSWRCQRETLERALDKLTGDTPLERLIPNTNHIRHSMHCQLCLDEIVARVKETGHAESPSEYARIQVGYTEIGIQVWCRRHDRNIAHIDFEGMALTQNLTAPQKC